VLITHDLQAAQEADSIFFLMDGRIVESGTHQSLMTLDREYAAMVRRRKFGTLGGEVACASNA
jgi:ATP-binding cassette subfamily B protein